MILEKIESKLSLLRALGSGIITDGYMIMYLLDGTSEDRMYDNAIYMAYALGKGYNIIIGEYGYEHSRQRNESS